MHKNRFLSVKLINKSLLISLPILLIFAIMSSWIKINYNLVLGDFLNPFSYLLFSIAILIFLLVETITLLKELKNNLRIALFYKKVLITKKIIRSMVVLLIFTLSSASISLLELFNAWDVATNFVLYASIMALIAISNLLIVSFFIVLTFYLAKYQKEDVDSLLLGLQSQFSLMVEESDFINSSIKPSYNEKKFNKLILTYLLNKNKDIFIIINSEKAEYLSNLKKGTMPPNELLV